MLLQDVYDHLSYGELSSLSISGKRINDPNISGISRDSLPQLLPVIKLGLSDIYKRLNLREVTEVVELIDGTSTYTLEDTNIIKVGSIFATLDSKPHEVTLNTKDDLTAINFSSLYTFTIPTDESEALWLKETTSLKVISVGNHPIIDTSIANDTPELVTLDLPDLALNALLYYVAHKLHTPKGIVGEFHQGSNYAALYQSEIQGLKLENIELDSFSADTRLTDRGFV